MSYAPTLIPSGSNTLSKSSTHCKESQHRQDQETLHPASFPSPHCPRPFHVLPYTVLVRTRENGVVTVPIDPLFAKTVNLDIDYQVFLTPVDGWAALYVADKSSTGFTVRDADGQSDTSFDYRIVARRAGYEDVRLESVTQLLATDGMESDE